MSTERTSVLIKIDIHDLIEGCGWERIWSDSDDALTEQIGDGDRWNLTEIAIEVEGHEADILLVRVHGTPEQ